MEETQDLEPPKLLSHEKRFETGLGHQEVLVAVSVGEEVARPVTTTVAYCLADALIHMRRVKIRVH